MRRQAIGTYETRVVGNEQVHAFVPAPLPPSPPLALEGSLQQLLEDATLAVGRLDTIATLLPDRSLLLYSYVRKEALLSSQIEGTQSSLSDLLLFELEEAPGAPIDDVVEVSSYVAAMEHGQRRLAEDFPLSNRLVREVHAILLSRGRGSDKLPGEFRTSQNWIGGTRPGNAAFVPPPHTAVPDCMGELERFLHGQDDGVPTLVRAGLAHLQFETIHPFLDGNGRVGRLLVVLLLLDRGVLSQPLLYTSLYLKQNRPTYYRMLDHVRHTGDWEAWLSFFLEGVRTAAEGAVATARSLTDMFAAHRTAIENDAGRRAGSVLRVHEALKERPILSLSAVSERTKLSFRTADLAMQWLVGQGIAREITGRSRNRLFAYDKYLAALAEGTETL